MVRFEVRRSPIHGHGLFALSLVPGKRKLGELGGRIIPEREARRHDAEHCIKLVEFGDGWALDASVDSNCFQFVDHSCAPNAYIRCFRHRVELYSLREIEAGEELTCNYGATQHDGALSCRCGSARCRRWL